MLNARLISERENFMKKNKKDLLKFLAVTFAVSLLAAYLIMDYTDRYLLLNRPPLAPPQWVFPVVWNILYFLMSVAATMAYTSSQPGDKRNVLIFYGLQLAVNFTWPIFFFRIGNVMLALYALLALWVLVLINIILYARINKYASYLLIPYIAWVSFAAYLNYSIYLLN